MDQNEINQKEWENPQNWITSGKRGRAVYRSSADSRLWVPRREGGGSTMNFGNRRGQIILLILFLAVPLLILLFKFLAVHFGWFRTGGQ